MEILHRRAAPEKPDFSDLYEQYYSNLLFYCIRKIGNREDAEDLVEEVFLYCYDHYTDYDPAKSAVSTWLYLVLNSRIKNHYRDFKPYEDISALENILQSEDSDLEKGVYLQQLRSFLSQAISHLPERQQQVVILKYFHDKSSKEIAEIMGITPVNARVLLSRALDDLNETCQKFMK